MPRTRSLAWAELKIGIVSTIAIVLAIVLIFLLSGEGGFFWQRYSIKAVFSDVAGLKAGAPVRIAGVEVGEVSEVRFVGDRVEVVMEIGESHRERVTTASRATLGSVSLLGESAIDITASSEGTPIPEWGYVPTGDAGRTLADVTSHATAGIEEATALLRDIRSGRGTVGRLFTDDSVYRDLNEFVRSAERVTRLMAEGDGTMARLLNDDVLYRELSASIRDLSAVTERIRSGEGSLGRLVNDPAFSEALTSTTRNIEGVTAKLNAGEGTAGRLLNETVLYDRLNATMQRLDAITTSLDAGEGTLGQLLKDRQLYENMNQTILELRDFLAAVRKDPRKYLNVRVSIF